MLTQQPQETNSCPHRGEIRLSRLSLRPLWTLREARFSSRVPGCCNGKLNRRLRLTTKGHEGCFWLVNFVALRGPSWPFVVHSFLQLS